MLFAVVVFDYFCRFIAAANDKRRTLDVQSTHDQVTGRAGGDSEGYLFKYCCASKWQ